MTMRTEAEMLAEWGDQETPLVSIACITYNHESYIADAIEGFLKQRTDFPFEIVIHDDASTDKTADIIRFYLEKYQRIIKPIFQKENQASQLKKNLLLPIILTTVSHAKGRYIAYCDGDDYWTDSNKLAIQIAEMQKYSNCNVSFHPVFRQRINGKKRAKIIAKHSAKNKIFKPKQLILGAAKFCPTVSFIFKANVFESIPKWLFDAPCTDYFLQVLASLNGGAIYISKVMAVYRACSSGSWSEQMSKNKNLVYSYFTGMLSSLDDIDNYMNKKYTNEIGIIKKKLCFFMCTNPTLSLEERRKIFQENNAKFNFNRKLIWFLIFRNKKFCELMYNVKSYIFD